MMTNAGFRRVILALGAITQGACSGLGYYVQSIDGQLGLLAKREPITRLVEDAGLGEDLRATLRTVLDIRTFASQELHLPDNASYRTYADVGRSHAVWVVFATPEFSLHPREWCFPVVGCVSYRGYFSAHAASRYAGKLSSAGYDTYVGGVRAFSTLGWFADPLLSTMLDQSPTALVAMIFHELAHQRLYIKGDTRFNEAFAVTVEREGVERWLRAWGDREALQTYRRSAAQHEHFLSLIDVTRDQLTTLYRQPLATQDKRRYKAQIFRGLQQAVKRSEALHQTADYERWVAAGPNNAKLASVATYYDLVPAFQRLLAFHEYDLVAFYRACETLAALATDERNTLLAELLDGPSMAQPNAAGTRGTPPTEPPAVLGGGSFGNG